MTLSGWSLSVLALASGALLATSAARADESPKSAPASVQTEARELLPATPIEREFKAGEAHSYRITLGSGQYLRVVVDQRGIDVTLKLFGPDGLQLAESNSSPGKSGQEQISVIAQVSGDYRLELISVEREPAQGRYEVKTEALRTATPQDESCVAADRAFADGARLAAQRTAASARDAIKKYEQALSLYRSGDDRRGEVNALNKIGGTYRLIGDDLKALEFYVQALPISHSLGDKAVEGHTVNSIGEIYGHLGEPLKGLEYLDRALALRSAVGDRVEQAATLNSIGLAYAHMDEPQRELESFNQSLALAREVGSRRVEAQVLNNLAWVYLDLGEYQEALELFGELLTLLRASTYRFGEAVVLQNIGVVQLKLGQPRKALEYLAEALSLHQAGGNRVGESETLSRIGDAYHDTGEMEKGLAVLSKAIGGHRELGLRGQEAFALDLIGQIHAATGARDQALDYYRQALQLKRLISDQAGEALTLFNIARLSRDSGNLTEAKTQIETALSIIESLRARVVSPDLRASYIASNQNVYDFYIDLLMQMGARQPAEALNGMALLATERARARSLVELLVEARADIRQGVDPALLDRERSLQQRLSAKAERLTGLLSGKHTENEATAAKKEVELLLTERQQVQAQIRAVSPRYAALTQPAPLSLKEIQQLLDNDTLLLEYSLGKERSYLWAVTPTSLMSFELPGRAEIEAAAGRFHALLSQGDKIELRAQVRLAALSLSRIILAPVAAQLSHKRLLIVADGALQYVPFAALPEPEVRPEVRSQRSEVSVQRPLIVNHEIIALPSASVLSVLRREIAGRQVAAKQVAVLADPVLDDKDPRVRLEAAPTERRIGEPVAGTSETKALTRAASESGVGTFERLRYTRQEADSIMALASPGTGFEAVDFEASKATATGGSLSQYRIIHFATHGLINSRHPELSGIVLSLVDEHGKPQDGFLRLHDVYNLKLSADLVVLSACRTALGKDVKGEGLVGLTRGFMYAGAPRVVASLWDVRDEATAELMKRFYEAMLRQGMAPAAALRAAQLSITKEKRWEAPYYWAGFILQGEWR